MRDYSTDNTETSENTLGLGRRGDGNTVALDDVFDDPEHGEPGRDRMAIHAVWELLLLLGVAALGFLVWQDDRGSLRGESLDTLLVTIAGLGLITLGMGLSLRAAAPNLAVGPVAVAAGVFYAKEGNEGVVPTTGVIVLAAAALGVALAILVVGFHVPGWAASLGAVFAAVVWLQKQAGTVELSGGYEPRRHALYLVGGFAALAILGALVGSIKTMRRALGRFRPIGDPARRRGGIAASLTAAALIASTVQAAVGGVLLAGLTSSVTPANSLFGLRETGLALGAALLGGTSAFGRRGGIFGTLLAVLLVVLFTRYEQVQEWRISSFAIAGGAIVGGLIVTRLVESLGRPRPADEDGTDDWSTAMGSGQPVTPSTWATPRDSWSSSLPAQPATGRPSDLWSEDRWSSRSG